MSRSCLFLAPALLLLTAGVCAAQPTPLHAYELNNSLADTFGGPSMVNNGGALGPTGITFGPNQGPSLSNWITGGTATSGNYSIEMYFRISNTSGFRKLIDFKNLTSDTGLYNLNTALNFFNLTTGPAGAIPTDVVTHLVFTRDGGTNDIVGYINGSAALGFSTNDGSGLATFTAANNIMNFFIDDTATSQNEASAGFVDFIRIYDRPVTAQEAAALFAAATVPEPATMLLAGGGVGITAWAYRRRRKVVKYRRR